MAYYAPCLPPLRSCSIHAQVNPVTAWGFLEETAVPDGEFLLQNAANSVLGQELISLAQYRGVQLINLVRRREVVKDLEAVGCVLVSDAAE